MKTKEKPLKEKKKSQSNIQKKKGKGEKKDEFNRNKKNVCVWTISKVKRCLSIICMFVSVVLLNFVNVTFLQTYIRHDMGSKAKKKKCRRKEKK